MDRRFYIILGMAAVTYLPRLFPMLALTRWQAPTYLMRWLRHIPAAVFTALLFPNILLDEGKVALDFDNLQLWGTLCCVLVVWRTRNLALTVIAGVLLIFLLRVMMD